MGLKRRTLTYLELLDMKKDQQKTKRKAQRHARKMTRHHLKRGQVTS